MFRVRESKKVMRLKRWVSTEHQAPASQEEPGRLDSSEEIHLDDEKKAAIMGAMKNVRINYIPAWATRLSDKDLDAQVDALAAARKHQRQN